MSNIVDADYTLVYERTLPVIISEIKIIEQNTARVVLENGIQIGQRLQEAKEKVGHGGFGDWCQENLNYSQDTAQKFMRLAKEYGDPDSVLANTAMSRNFSISNALSLLKLPEEDRKQFVEEHPIEDMTNKALEDEIRKLKEEKEADKDKLNRVKQSVIWAKEEADKKSHEIEDLKRQLQEAEDSAADSEEIESLQRNLTDQQKELAKLELELEKEKEKTKKAKEKLKTEKDSRQAEIDAAIEKERQGIIDQANAEAADRMNKITGENEELRKALDDTSKKLERLSQGTLLQFKVMTDQLQDAFAKCGELILEEQDQETADKMNVALRAIVQAFEEAL